jgi:hypothetical protein
VPLRAYSAPRSSPVYPLDSPTPGKTESGKLKAERLSDHVDRKAFLAFDFQLSAFLDAPGCCFVLENPMPPPGETKKRKQKVERLSDHIDREALSAFDFQLSAFPRPGSTGQ